YLVQGALGLPDPFGRPLVVTNQGANAFNAYIEEVRLASKPDSGPFEWLVGGYLQRTKEPSRQFDPSNLGVVIPPLDPLLLDQGAVFDNHTTVRRKQDAVFGEASYTIWDKLKLTAGLRLT